MAQLPRSRVDRPHCVIPEGADGDRWQIQRQLVARADRGRQTLPGLQDGAHIGRLEPPEPRGAAQRADDQLAAIDRYELDDRRQLVLQPQGAGGGRAA